MKNLLTFAIGLLLSMTLNAQVYVGGNLGLSLSRDVRRGSLGISGTNQLSVAPEVGYTFNKYLSMGASLGYALREGESSSLSLVPYFRYTFMQWEHFGLFVEQ